MLQRAASNACSWWWASHIRTKQSNWLEQSMQDMDEKVQNMLKLIEGEGDSFAKRAEMYYKRRPELVNSVEETFRAYKALADRYDLISKELQNANRTIATVFPDQVEFAMDDDDDYPASAPKNPKKLKNALENKANIPKVPKSNMESLKGLISTASKTFQPKKSSSSSSSSSKSKNRNKGVSKSGLSKDEALQVIDKAHKEILGLQTLREFVKSSYESGLAKYYDIENQITEMQEKVIKLQDEYDVEVVIEDNEARTLMAEAALKSCRETLNGLQEKQAKSNGEAEEESDKIETAQEILKSFKRDYLKEETGDVSLTEDEESAMETDEEVSGLIKELKDMILQKGEKGLDSSSIANLTVSELAEKIDEVVNRVITLETAVSTHTVLINTLRTESDDLYGQVKSLESEKESLIGDNENLGTTVKEMEIKLNRLQNLNKNVESLKNNLEANFVEERSSLDLLTEKLTGVKPDEEVELTEKMQEEIKDKLEGKSKKKKDKEKKDKEKKDKESKSKKKKDKHRKDDPLPSSEDSKDKHKKDDPPPSSDDGKLQDEEKKDAQTIDENKVEEKEDVKEVDTSAVQNLETSVPVKEDKPVESLATFMKKEDDKPVDRLATFDKPVERFATFTFMKKEVDKPVERLATFTNTKVKEYAHDETAEGETEIEGDLSWQQVLLSGADGREKILLKEYTKILRNYKDVKRRLSDTEKKDKDIQFEIILQMRDLKQAITKRDHEIQSLRQQLSNLQENKDATTEEGEPKNLPPDSSEDQLVKPMEESDQTIKDPDAPAVEKEDDDLKTIFEDKSPMVSAVEEKLRMELDAILDENLDFWLRFSTSFHLVQKFKSEVEDLQDEIAKLKEKKKQEGCNTCQIRSEVRPIYKHLREIQTELTVWLEQRVRLKEELKRRFTSLCNIQEEITVALKEGVEEDEIKFTSHHAAKMQGEILNMKQENNKVREELQACLDHVSVLQLDVEKTLRQLNAQFGIASDQPQLQHSMSRSKVPLRSFIFGTNEKKKKNSLFSFMNHHRKYHVVRALPSN